VWLGFLLLELAPSPKSHDRPLITPVELSVKRTTNVPARWLQEKRATGGGLWSGPGSSIGVGEEKAGDSDGRIDGSRLGDDDGTSEGNVDGEGVAVGWATTARVEARPVGMAANCVGPGDPGGRVDRNTARAPPARRTVASRTAPIASPPGMPPRPTRSPARGKLC
jgi:hypothetical protein